MKYLHQIFAPALGEPCDNQELMSLLEPFVQDLEMPAEEKKQLWDFVRFQLVGERSRRSMTADWDSLISFAAHSHAFERGVESACDALAAEILPVAEAAGVTFDALVATTATGNLMPGVSYRLARRLGDRIRPDSTLVDLSNVGCTGSLKALNLVNRLDDSFKNILVAAVEVPTSLVDIRSTRMDIWQGNCTFGDGAAAIWVSTDVEQGPEALALEQIHYRHWSDTGIDLIRWGYHDYYTFALADEKTFERDVKEYVVQTLAETEAGWKEEPRWAIHPAGIALLVRLTRKLGIPMEAIKPSASCYREFSNMSSASILHILKNVAETAEPEQAINLLTMGAGFNVIYGRVRRAR